MNYHGLTLRFDPDSIEALLEIEDWNHEDAISELEGAPGVEIDYSSACICHCASSVGFDITNEPALRAWVEKRLRADEWDKLREECPEIQRENREIAADDERDYYRSRL